MARFARVVLCTIIAFAGSVPDADAKAKDGLTYLEGGARFSDIARVVEGRLAAGEPATTTLLGPLCTAYGELKRYDKLFDCVAKLQARIAAGDKVVDADYPMMSGSRADSLPGMLLAKAYLDLGDYQRSTKEGEAAMAALPAGGSFASLWPPIRYRVSILPNLAIAEALSGDREQAQAYLAQLEAAKVPYAGGGITRPIRENGLARAYMALGDYPKAIEHLGGPGGWAKFSLALSSQFTPFPSNGDDISTIFELPRLFMVAKAMLETGQLAQSRAAFDQLFANKRLPDLQEIYWLALYERARLEFLEKHPDDALRDLKSAIDVIETQRSSLNNEASKIGFAGSTQDVYHLLVASLIDAGNLPDAFAYVERSKSRALVDMLAAKHDFSSPPAVSAKVQELLSRIDQTEAQALETPFTASLPADNPAPATRGGARTTVLREIAGADPELGSLVSVSAVPLADIQKRIPADEALVEYYYDAQSLFAFVLTSDALQGVRLDGNGLEDDVRLLRTAIKQPDSDVYLRPAQRLHARLIKPVEPLLGGRTHLVVVAHGVLHYLPFAALLDEGNGFLVDRYSLRFLPSASVVEYLHPSGLARPGGILAFGNPDLGDPKYDLRFAQEEAIAVAQTMPQSKALVRGEATETALREYAPGFRYLHFATHGEFDAQSPLQSALLLARDASGSGQLTVGKLYSMRLDSDLVTLSACETGLGKTASGDDVIGLSRGFLYAGASSIVASLWQVDDKATEALMTAFYEGLKANDKREALRKAQLAARVAYPHPFYWAAFQLTGSAN